jgi:hypothetical protein
MDTIVDTKREFLDAFVLKYKKGQSSMKKDQKPENLQKSVTSVLNTMTEVFEKKDALLQARASVVIYYLLFRSAIKSSKLESITRRKISAFVRAVDRNREIAESNLTDAKFDLLEYHRLSIQGTNDANSIRERLRIIANYFKIQPDYGRKDENTIRLT